MRDIEFMVLLSANTYKTANIRTCAAIAQHWDKQVEKIPDAVTNSIGRVVRLIQERVNQDFLCKKAEEYLLIYNVEVMSDSSQNFYWNLAVVIKPLSQITETTSLTGNHLILAINGRTGEVMNATKCLLEIGAQKPEEINWKAPQEIPVSYGNYHAYLAPCSFLALISYKPITDLADLFKGCYDNSEVIQKGKIFDSFIEADNYLVGKRELGLFIAELPYPKEEVESLKQEGLGKKILLVINYLTKVITVTQDTFLLSRYPIMQEEAERFKSVFMTSEQEIKASDRKSPALEGEAKKLTS